jgi:hypothetical protein
MRTNTFCNFLLNILILNFLLYLIWNSDCWIYNWILLILILKIFYFLSFKFISLNFLFQFLQTRLILSKRKKHIWLNINILNLTIFNQFFLHFYLFLKYFNDLTCFISFLFFPINFLECLLVSFFTWTI